MSDGIRKVNAAPAVAVPLAAASQGFQAVSKLAAQQAVKDKISKVGSVSGKVVQTVDAQKDLFLAILGVAVLLHGAQFKNLFLCTQLLVTFLFARMKSSVMTVYNDVVAVAEKAKADATPADDKDKKAGSDAVQKAHVKTATSVLKALDSERITSATKEVLICVMACLLVIHGGLPAHVVVAHGLVGSISKRVLALLHFEGFEGLESWTVLMVHFALWLVFLPLSCFMGSVTLVLNTAVAGASLAVHHGALFLVKSGKLADADVFLQSKTALIGFASLMLVGTFWQVWALMADSGISWFFYLPYLPFIVAEGVLGLF